MQTIIIKLSPSKLANPDLDLRYLIPDRIEEISQEKIRDNGYDYIDDGGPSLGIWLEADDAVASVAFITELFQKERFLENDLSQSAEIYISEQDTAALDDCRKVYPISGSNS